MGKNASEKDFFVYFFHKLRLLRNNNDEEVVKKKIASVSHVLRYSLLFFIISKKHVVL